MHQNDDARIEEEDETVQEAGVQLELEGNGSIIGTTAWRRVQREKLAWLDQLPDDAIRKLLTSNGANSEGDATTIRDRFVRHQLRANGDPGIAWKSEDERPLTPTTPLTLLDKLEFLPVATVRRHLDAAQANASGSPEVVRDRLKRLLLIDLGQQDVPWSAADKKLPVVSHPVPSIEMQSLLKRMQHYETSRIEEQTESDSSNSPVNDPLRGDTETANRTLVERGSKDLQRNRLK